MTQEVILNCFISGLALKIRNEMIIHTPISISRAIGLAKLIEAKLKDGKPKLQKPLFDPFTRMNPTFKRPYI